MGTNQSSTQTDSGPRSYFLPEHIVDAKKEYDVLQRVLYPTHHSKIGRLPYLTDQRKIDDFKALDRVDTFKSKAKPGIGTIIYPSDHSKYNLKKKRMGRGKQDDTSTMSYLTEDKKTVTSHSDRINGDYLGKFMGIPSITEEYTTNEFSSDDQELIGGNKTHLDLMLRNWRRQNGEDFNMAASEQSQPPTQPNNTGGGKNVKQAKPPRPSPQPSAGGGPAPSGKDGNWTQYFHGN
jgi:hypothetical protein